MIMIMIIMLIMIMIMIMMILRGASNHPKPKGGFKESFEKIKGKII